MTKSHIFTEIGMPCYMGNYKRLSDKSGKTSVWIKEGSWGKEAP